MRISFNTCLLEGATLRGWNRYTVNLLARLPALGIEPPHDGELAVEVDGGSFAGGVTDLEHLHGLDLHLPSSARGPPTVPDGWARPAPQRPTSGHRDALHRGLVALVGLVVEGHPRRAVAPSGHSKVTSRRVMAGAGVLGDEGTRCSVGRRGSTGVVAPPAAMGCGWLEDDRGAVEATAAVSRRG